MSVRASSVLLATATLALLGLAGCQREAPPVAAFPEEVAAPARPDPSAPAPGTQAAEAIGVDSSKDGVVAASAKRVD